MVSMCWDWWIGRLVDWWIGGLVDVDWLIGGLVAGPSYYTTSV